MKCVAKNIFQTPDILLSQPDLSFVAQQKNQNGQSKNRTFWFVQSEKMYYQQHQAYYKNIRLLGLEYPELDYKQALPFLLMLPNAVFNS